MMNHVKVHPGGMHSSKNLDGRWVRGLCNPQERYQLNAVPEAKHRLILIDHSTEIAVLIACKCQSPFNTIRGELPGSNCWGGKITGSWHRHFSFLHSKRVVSTDSSKSMTS